jgi:DNA-binding NarL/FixJ family response regulator
MNIVEILAQKYSGTEWTLVGDNYEGLEWLDNSPKPTKSELEAHWPEVQANISNREQARQSARQSALAKLAALGLTEEEIAAL